MHREWLLTKLEKLTDYRSKQICEFIRREPQCFERSCLEGHVTGSGFVLNHDRSQVLLTHHKKLGLWLQFGGHSDGEGNTAEVAYREAQEESGIENLEFITEEIVDTDTHLVPAFGGEPQHYHYDIRFFFKAPKGAQFKVNEESHELKWFTPQEVRNLGTDESVLRLIEIWETNFKSLIAS